jgi:hypothetical protein
MLSKLADDFPFLILETLKVAISKTSFSSIGL